MRFTVELNLKGKPPFLIQADYRKNITSMIKEACKSIDGGHEFYFKYWGNWTDNKVKPFTFSLFIPKPRMVIIDDTGFLEFDDNTMSLHITSIDQDFLIVLYKGLLKINKSYSPFSYPIEFSNIFIRKNESINSDIARFKIMSPIVVRDIMVRGYNKRFKGYLSPDDENYQDALIHSIRNLCKRFLSKNNKKIKMAFIDIDTSDCYSVRINHYSEVIPAAKGVIGIRADKDILRVIYNAGIGARRSQGFGMVEIFKKSYNTTQKKLVANC